MTNNEMTITQAKRVHSLFWNYDHYWKLDKKSFEQAKVAARTAVLMKEYERGASFPGYDKAKILKALPQAINDLKYVKKKKDIWAGEAEANSKIEK